MSSLKKIVLGLGVLSLTFILMLVFHKEEERQPSHISIVGKAIDTVPVSAYYSDLGAYVVVNGRCIAARATSNLNTELPGMYLIEYDYADTNFTAATVTRTVHVVR